MTWACASICVPRSLLNSTKIGEGQVSNRLGRQQRLQQCLVTDDPLGADRNRRHGKSGARYRAPSSPSRRAGHAREAGIAEGTARLWFNGKLMNSGPSRDAEAAGLTRPSLPPIAITSCGSNFALSTTAEFVEACDR